MLAALLCVAGAIAVGLFAGLLDWLACESGACFNEQLARIQLVIAWAALVPTIAFGAALVVRRRRLSRWSFSVMLMTYLLWALLADAAHHGWGDLKFFPF